MKAKLSTILLVGAMVSIPLQSSLSAVGGVYKGGTKRNYVTNPAQNYPDMDLNLRLPNRKGGLSGLLLSRRAGAPGNVRIAGKVKKYKMRQGGNKHIYVGVWNWKLTSWGAPSDASGTFRFKVKKVPNGYTIAPAAKVKVHGVDYTYLAKMRAWRRN